MKPPVVDAGFTLIETVVVIVVLAVAITGVFSVFHGRTAASADPMLNQQAVAIGQGYLEEALLKAYTDPEGGETGTCEEATRGNYDDVLDYNCVNDSTGARDPFGNGLAGLDDYNVTVTVTDTVLGAGVNTTPARRVVVLVTHDLVPGVRFQLNGHRTSY